MSSNFFSQASSYFIGLMSGTSLDGIDAVLTQIDSNGKSNGKCNFIAHVHQPFSPNLKDQFLTLQKASNNELHLEALSANQLAMEYADTVTLLLHQSQISADQVIAIGAHGQTIRHQPPTQGNPSTPQHLAYTWQSLNPALLAERAQIHVIADFRSRDVASGGQGAPLVPAFHAAQFASNRTTAVLNLGGIANLTLLAPGQPILGFDTGPANVLMNDWTQLHLHQPFDEGGQWAQSGEVIKELVSSFMSEPYFAAPIPKSTGRDLFHLEWVSNHLANFPAFKACDVQASLVALTAQSIAHQLFQHLPHCEELIVCGGGVRNQFLMHQITTLSQQKMPHLLVNTSEKYGVDAQTVEALAFAWLAWCFTQGLPGNVQSVTGALGPRMLGAFYPK